MVIEAKRKNYILYYKNEIFIGICLGFIISGIYLYIYKYKEVFLNKEDLKRVIDYSGDAGVLIFIFIQAIQVIIFFIPGEIFQIAGGYIYGVFWGSIITFIGICIGSMSMFWISRKLGKPFVEKFLSKKILRTFNKVLQLEGRRGNLIIFMIYFMPGLPKDIVGYLSGMTKIHFRDFMFFSTMGRFPGIVLSSAIGNGIISGNKSFLILTLVCAGVLLIWGIFRGEALLKLIKEES